MQTRSIPTPLGSLLLVGDGDAVRGLYYPDHRPAPQLGTTTRDDALLDEAVRELEEWFAGTRTRFDVAVEFTGTDFQRRVWMALRDIPYGETVSYGELAATLGRPAAARAIGHAVARNPISIIVPCHRVVGTNGRLTGYAGGVERKAHLLELERKVSARSVA